GGGEYGEWRRLRRAGQRRRQVGGKDSARRGLAHRSGLPVHEQERGARGRGWGLRIQRHPGGGARISGAARRGRPSIRRIGARQGESSDVGAHRTESSGRVAYASAPAFRPVGGVSPAFAPPLERRAGGSAARGRGWVYLAPATSCHSPRPRKTGVGNRRGAGSIARAGGSRAGTRGGGGQGAGAPLS